MSRPRLYADHNAAAPVLPEALAAALEAAAAGGNPSSVHAEGREVRRRVEAARRAVADLAGVAPGSVIFTSGATEANATALTPTATLAGRPLAFDRLLIGATEHPSVTAGGRFAPDRIEKVPVDGDGLLRRDVLAARLTAIAAAGERALVSVQLANSETGVIQPIGEIAALVHGHGGFLHCDAVQGAGRLPLDVPDLDVDLMSLSAHKIGGLAGTGALVLRNPELVPAALLGGGGQEANRRAGTQNTPGIVAFGVAAAAARANARDTGALRARRDRLEDLLRSNSSNVKVLGVAAPRLANTSMVAVAGVSAETAVIAFDLEGVAISAGSACSSGKVGVSPVVAAMGLDRDVARGALRLSIGRETSDADVERLAEVWARVVGRMAGA